MSNPNMLGQVNEKCRRGHTHTQMLEGEGFNTHHNYRKARVLFLGIQSSLIICEELFPGITSDTKIRGCSSPLYKTAEYCRPSVSAGCASADLTNSGWKFFESANSEPENTKGRLNTQSGLSHILCLRA